MQQGQLGYRDNHTAPAVDAHIVRQFTGLFFNCMLSSSWAQIDSIF